MCDTCSQIVYSIIDNCLDLLTSTVANFLLTNRLVITNCLDFYNRDSAFFSVSYWSQGRNASLYFKRHLVNNMPNYPFFRLQICTEVHYTFNTNSMGHVIFPVSSVLPEESFARISSLEMSIIMNMS